MMIFRGQNRNSIKFNSDSLNSAKKLTDFEKDDLKHFWFTQDSKDILYLVEEKCETYHLYSINLETGNINPLMNAEDSSCVMG